VPSALGDLAELCALPKDGLGPKDALTLPASFGRK
jgi:hypothetical protein